MKLHPLVPFFIQERLSRKETHGAFQGAVLFLDISGFSTMTDALMTHGQHGAEVLAEVMRSVFDPMIETIFSRGGFIATSAGDALTALFPSNGLPELAACLNGLDAACEIQAHVRDHSTVSTEYRPFTISTKIGLATGRVDWGIVQASGSHRHAFYFQGRAVNDSASAEHHAAPGETILDGSILAAAGDQLAVEPVAEYFRLLRNNTSPLPSQVFIPPEPDLDILRLFYPETVITQAVTGEFRQAVSMFISLPSVRTETQLHIFMDTVFELQEQYGGLINRLDFGDKGTNLLLFWGAPVVYENDIERALSFILDLQSATSIPIRAGVTYRIAHAGYVGGRLHEEYTCSGRGVNLAARFMMDAQHGEIWVDEDIASRAGRRFEIEYLKDKIFKGFQDPQKIFLLLERKDEFHPYFEGGMAGRQVELKQMETFIEPVLAGRFGGMLVVSGEPGVGKSRLVHEFLENLSVNPQNQLQVLVGQSDGILPLPFHPFIYLLKDYFGISPSLGEVRSKRAFQRKLEVLISQTQDQKLVEELDRTRSFIGALLGLQWPDSLYEQIDEAGRYKNTQAGLTALFQSESLRAPLVIFIEDIHWLDPDSQSYLSQLLQDLSAPVGQAYPAAVIATNRNPGAPFIQAGIPVERLDLAGMQPDDLSTLASSLLGGQLSPSLTVLIIERSEGNPFFAEQILHYLREDNQLVSSQGQWSIEPGDAGQIPVDVNVLLVARIDRLDARVKEVVQSAAVLGREFNKDLLCAMLPDPTGAVLAQILAAENEAIWSPLSDGNYIFQHSLLREAAYQMQVVSRRRALHKQAFHAIEARFDGSLPEHYSELTYHAAQANLRESARMYALLAGNQSLAAFHNWQALDYFTSALQWTEDTDLPGRLETLIARELVYERMNRTEERARDLEGAWALAENLEDDDKVIHLLVRRSWYALNTDRLEDASTFALQAAQKAEAKGFLDKASSAYWHLAIAAKRLGRLDESNSLGLLSLELARQAGSTEHVCNALNSLGLSALEQGKTNEATNYFQESLEIANASGDILLQGPPLNNLGILAGWRGDYGEMVHYYEQALVLARKNGSRSSEVLALGNLGYAYGSLGQYEMAIDYTLQQLRAMKESGRQYYEALALINLSSFSTASSNPTLGEQYARQALDLSVKIGDRSLEAWSQTYLGFSMFESGHLVQAETAFRAAIQIRSALDEHDLACEPIAGLARVQMASGDLPAALRSIAPVIAFIDNGGALDRTDQPLLVLWSIYQVLSMAGTARCKEFLNAAYHRLQERAARLADPSTQESYKSRIGYHRAIIKAWLQNQAT